MPVLERVFDEFLRRHGDNGVVEVAHLDSRERDVLDSTVGTSLADCNPVALAPHIVARKADARYKTRYCVLKHEHKYSRCGTESGKQSERTAVDDDRNDDDDTEKNHYNLQYTAEGMQILLCGRTLVVVVEELERTDKGGSQSHCGYGNVYSRSLKDEALYYRVVGKYWRHKHPNDNGRHNVACSPDYLWVKQIVVPYNIGTTCDACGKWRHHLDAQQVDKPCYECYGGE